MKDFLQAMQEIGTLACANGRYQELIFRSVEWKWRDLTVDELLTAIDKADEEFNRLEQVARNDA